MTLLLEVQGNAILHNGEVKVCRERERKENALSFSITKTIQLILGKIQIKNQIKSLGKKRL